MIAIKELLLSWFFRQMEQPGTAGSLVANTARLISVPNRHAGATFQEKGVIFNSLRRYVQIGN